VSYAGDTAWNCDGGQADAARKSLLADIRDAAGNRHAGKPLAIPKR